MSTLQLSETVDVNDFLTELEPDYNWCIPGVLEQGDRAIFTGNEGKGKSTLLRQWAIQVAMGVHPFTQEAIPPKRVWLVDLENPRGHLRREVRKTKRALPIDVGYLNINSWPEGLNLGLPEYKLLVHQRLSEIKPDLVIIGPMYKMMPDLETETASAQLAFEIDRWRSLLKCTVIMESHQPHAGVVDGKRYRAERPFGSSLWLRWPEFGICLEDDGRLRHWRGARDERDWPTKLKREGFWPWETDDLFGQCQVCQGELTGKQTKYCGEECRNVGVQREYRARAKA